MSITFALRTASGDFACTADHGVCTVAEHLLDEEIAAYSHQGWCVECSTTNRDACELCGVEVNMSNVNAGEVLNLLGVGFGEYGGFDPADLFGRVEVARIGLDDSGVPEYKVRTLAGGVTIECGRGPGYFGGRFDDLTRLIDVAMTRGLCIEWS